MRRRDGQITDEGEGSGESGERSKRGSCAAERSRRNTQGKVIECSG